MEHNDRSRSGWLLGCCFFPASLVLAAVIAIQLFSSANAETSAASYAHGVLKVKIPFRAETAGAGRLTLEVLDPENHAIGRAEKKAVVAGGASRWNEEIKLEKPLSLDDLVWHRLHYRFAYDNDAQDALEGMESISEILCLPVVHVLGQQSYLAGSRAAVRVVVSDSNNEVIPGAGWLRIELLSAGDERRVLFEGRLNQRGTSEAQFRFPPGLTGNFRLHYKVDTAIGSSEVAEVVRLEDKVSVLLTTEKPIYQPGQTIHARALALDRSNHQAAGNRELVFEVEDSRGNKVFKKATRTDEFGVASAEFGLADEVNQGTYHLRALPGAAGSEAANFAEIALHVEKYVLPKFKVDIDLAGTEGKAKHGYRPGDHVTGTVEARYFFGKALDKAEVTVKVTAMDVERFTAGSAIGGRTDRQGSYHFDLQLAPYFAARPPSPQAARVLLEVTVKDSAGHAESRGVPIAVSESAFLVTAVPEGGTLVPGLENQIFLLAAYPDGSPARADLKIRAGRNREQVVSTDEGGVAVVELNPAAGNAALEVEGKDKDGNSVATKIPLEARGGDDQVLLRTERAVYRPGDAIHLKVRSTEARGTAYVDVVRDQQTILTRDLDIRDGQAELWITATPEMAGTLDCNAYIFSRNAQPVADHRLVFIEPANELKIQTAADAVEYKPGAEARIRFKVRNSDGQGVRAALGVQIVDEAVFALAEKQPGFAKVFFYLEQEVMKPRYEIHSIGMPDVVESGEKPREDQRNLAARALFSATEMVHTNQFETEAGRTVPRSKLDEYLRRYRQQFERQGKEIAADIRSAFAKNTDEESVTKTFQKLQKAGRAAFRDPWGTNLELEPLRSDTSRTQYLIHSAGPDKRVGTGDDMTLFLYFRKSKLVAPRAEGDGKISVRIEHGEERHNGRIEISGTVADQAGGAVSGALVMATNMETGVTRTVLADGSGKFRQVRLHEGRYQISVSSPGFRASQATFTLAAYDRAKLDIRLRIADATETIEVVGGSAVIVGTHEAVAGPLAAGIAGGVAGGAMGGVFGGVIGGAGAADQIMLKEWERRPQMALAAPVPPLPAAKAVAEEKRDQGGSTGVHVRSYFPEALYINPEVITDRNGDASITVPVADSITTWRLALLASTGQGALGTGTSSLKVFQDFFADLDLPVTLTEGDRVTIPVAVYNFAEAKGNVSLHLEPDDWFRLVDDVSDKSLTVNPSEVGAEQFTLEAKRIGKFRLTLSARMDGSVKRADIVVREIEVVPNGREQSQVFNGLLESAVQHRVNFPASSIPGTSKIFVRLYPGPLSQIVEGMDAILRMPGGCFEQTSSSTYPNVLALDYMKRAKKLTPEVHARAEGYIANGYQRLLTFEVSSGGFSWFGNAPANKILTAYGLMEFYDMSQVHNVDPRLIERTQQWLAAQQQADGSWKPDASFINEGATNRYNSDLLRITAYIAWSLENTGYQGPALEKAAQFVEKHLTEKADAYTLAVAANFAVDYRKDREFARRAIELLLAARTEKGDQIFWSSEETGLYGTGTSANVETSGLAVQALLKWGQAAGTVRGALAYITAKKDASGAWGSTQATIMALRALLLASQKGTSDVRGKVEILLNGKKATRLTVGSDNSDLLHQFALEGVDPKGDNDVEVRFDGKGRLGYQVAGEYFIPWEEKPADEALAIALSYDRTHVAQDDIVTATATVRNNLQKRANMVMVDLGLPPGFDLLSEDLEAYQQKSDGQKGGRLEKFSLTATQAVLYFDWFAPGETVNLRFRLRAKYPVRARTFKSRVYEYYDPEVSSLARPVQLEVRKR
jgi:uncharacterized protein YfaS (alpha-2-macroglobulin family)